MKSCWSDQDAEAAIAKYAAQGVGRDLALRTYTTRLLGQDPRLVLHGGGNTSVKTVVRDLDGSEAEVLCVKGSGWDMGQIEPPGLPAVRLEPLRVLRNLDRLSDEDMVRMQRRNLLDPMAPNPSVETLLHAFVSDKFVDHTHANAVLALTDQPRGEELCREVFGERMAYVPYIMPGFGLAKAAAAAREQAPSAEGMILLKHGIFTFGETAREAYERMIEFVSLAEARLARPAREVHQIVVPEEVASPAEVAPVLRGLLARPTDDGDWTRWILVHRDGEAIMRYANGEEVARYATAGPATPDHVIRAKSWNVVLPLPRRDDLDGWTERARKTIQAYEREYETYFQRENERVGNARKALDPAPRVAVVPGVGIFAAGAGLSAASAAADLTEATAEVAMAAEGISGFEALPRADLFDVEYWPLEQAKLGKTVEKPLARRVTVITGGGGGIGRAIGAAFRTAGAEVALLDRDADRVEEAARAIGGAGIVCDVTSESSVAEALAQVCRRFGGVDILVSNAGAAWQGRIGDVSQETLRESFELNFFSHQIVAQQVVAIMRAQKTGGALLFNATKQALNPGPDFGPYGIPKTALLALMRQYALDHGRDGITANAVNADRIRSGLLTPDMITSRSTARGVSEDAYMRGNLIGREVRASDVAKAFVDLASSPVTTGAIVTVDGGNIAAAVR